MPAPGKGPGSASGTGGPGSMGGSGVGSKGGFGGTGKGPSNPTHNPLKYDKKKTKAFEATLSNLAQVGGTVLGALGGPIASVANMAASAAMGVDPLNPFEKPTGEADSFSFDKGAPGQDDELERPEAKKLAPPKPKKKKPQITGMTLLADAGGSLLGS